MPRFDKRLALATPQPRFMPTASVRDAARALMAGVPWGICAITAIAAALRLAELDDVAGNPFYDAAVHSMGMSWHNFFFSAFDPGGLLAVDKPPLDLWLQVGSTKLLGWNSFALKLPEVMGGTLAVPLLYDAVRGAFGRGAGLVAAASLAVTPVSVLTSRSDTMDSLMMLFLVAALWLTVRATTAGGRKWLVLAGVAFGLAFNVKLLEALIALPALVVLYAVGAPVARWRRVADIALAGAVVVVVSLSWAIAVTLAPGRHPFAIGSTSGTVLDVVFGFNGISRLAGNMTAGGTFAAPPAVFRLLSDVGGIGRLFGPILVAAIGIGGAALAVNWRRRPVSGDRESGRIAFAFSLATSVWLATGVTVLSYVSVMHARYLEAVTPAVAATLGCGLASLLRGALHPTRRALASLPILAAVLAGVCWYTASLGSSSVGRSVAFGAGAVLVLAAAVAVPRVARPAALLAGGLALACCLSFPIMESVALVRAAASDSPGLSVQPVAVESSISQYLRSRTIGVRYELAVDDPLTIAPLITSDGRAILPLTSFGAKPLMGVAQLQQAVRSGDVRYALVGSYRCPWLGTGAACVPAAIWARSQGIDVSAQAGIPATLPLKLYLLPR